MNVTSFEAIVENGQIQLPRDIQVPDHTRVYVVIPSAEPAGAMKLRSPHLAYPEHGQHFEKIVIKDDSV
jgi:hypothetical protein